MERYGLFSNVTGITSFRLLHLMFYIKYRSDIKFINIRYELEYDLNFISNLLLLKSYMQKYL